MGSISRGNRCERYIKEFAETAKVLYAPGPEGKKFFTAWSISFDEHTEQVKLYWCAKVDGKDVAFIPDNAPIFFDPEEQDDDLIERTMDIFELDRKTATERLQKADLIFRTK